MRKLRGIARVAGVVGAAMALSGCWPVPGQNPDRTAHNPFESKITPATVAGLTEVWATETIGMPAGDPVVSKGGVHMVVGGCAITTHRVSDGSTLWGQGPSEACVVDPWGAQETEQFSPPVVVGDTVAFGHWALREVPGPSPLPNLQAFTDLATYHVTTGEPAADVVAGLIPAGVRGDVSVATSPTWTYAPYPPPFPPQVLTGGSHNGRIGVAGDGTSRTFTIGGGGLPTLGLDVVFHAGPGTLATAPGDDTVGHAVRAFAVAEARPGCGPTGRTMECPLWAAPIDGTNSTNPVLAPDGSTVFVGTDAGTVYALDAATGAVRWTGAVGAGVTASPALADGVLHVPTADGRLVALAADGCGATVCGPQWSASTGGPPAVQPAVAGGVVVTGNDDGSVDAFDAAGCGAATCPALWSADAGAAVTGAPAVSAGRLYVGTADGRLVAYALPP